ELGLGLVQQVVEAIQRLLAERGVERAQAALDQDAARDYVPRAIAADIADSRMALHALVLESFDDRVQSLYEESLGGQHVAAAAHRSAVTAGSGELHVERVGAGPQKPGPRHDRSRLHEADDVQSDDDVRPLLLQQAARDHRFGAFDDLLGRLKNKKVFAVDVPDPVDQGPGDAEHD